MSVEKFFVLYFPLKTKSIFTVKTAKWISFGTFVILASFNCQIFFIKNTNNEHIQTYCKLDERFIKIFEYIDAILYSFGPFIIMGTANVAIMFKFLNAKLKRDIERAGSTSQALG